MIVIWKGKGPLVVPIAAGVWLVGVTATDAILGEDYYRNHDWPLMAIAGATAVVLWIFHRKYCSEDPRRLLDEESGETILLEPKHSLYFLKVKYWAVLLPALLFLIAWSRDSSQQWEHSDDFIDALMEDVSSRAQLFAPDILSDGMYQRDTAISSDYAHLLYSIQQGRDTRIMHMRREKGDWAEPSVAEFSETWRNLEPAFLPGTKVLVFASDRPLPEETEAGDFNLWRTQWDSGHWSEPEPLVDVNGDGNEFYPSLTAEGSLFFTTTREGGVGGEDIWVAAPDGDHFFPPQVVGVGVNSEEDEFNAAVDAAGTMLCFGSVRADGPGGGDLYLSRRQEDGSWGPATLLGSDVNSRRLDFCPFFDPEMDALWFTSTRETTEQPPTLGLADLRQAWSSPGNGSGDLYRIGLEAIEADVAIPAE